MPNYILNLYTWALKSQKIIVITDDAIFKDMFLSFLLSAHGDMKMYLNLHTLSRPLFEVAVSLRLSTPLTLKEPRACQRKLPCAKYIRRVRQTVPQEFAEFQGSCAGRGDAATTTVSIDWSIERTSRKFPNYATSKRHSSSGKKHWVHNRKYVAYSSALRFMRSLASLMSLTLVASKFLTRFLYSFASLFIVLWKSILL